MTNRIPVGVAPDDLGSGHSRTHQLGQVRPVPAAFERLRLAPGVRTGSIDRTNELFNQIAHHQVGIRGVEDRRLQDHGRSRVGRDGASSVRTRFLAMKCRVSGVRHRGDLAPGEHVNGTDALVVDRNPPATYPREL